MNIHKKWKKIFYKRGKSKKKKKKGYKFVHKYSRRIIQNRIEKIQELINASAPKKQNISII